MNYSYEPHFEDISDVSMNDYVLTPKLHPRMKHAMLDSPGNISLSPTVLRSWFPLSERDNTSNIQSPIRKFVSPSRLYKSPEPKANVADISVRPRSKQIEVMIHTKLAKEHTEIAEFLELEMRFGV
ncbi:hypothetical protein CANCADRAFT_31677 [Tortispora caseinolytica NRRL Y-17796]|uniref:Uncharacterized protein n=1 Tax=Tortispora caseinolytica NRRL Y-17796 TaxID=767744 RepID=A0A1E4TGJ7_9ASCO|nr:hypothetical protein CANCADRAFT_31677 [Tortispora caseinolytica NRRL Y-17796]